MIYNMISSHVTLEVEDRLVELVIENFWTISRKVPHSEQEFLSRTLIETIVNQPEMT